MDSHQLYIIYYLGLFTIIFFLSKFILRRYQVFIQKYKLYIKTDSNLVFQKTPYISAGIVYAVVLLITTICTENLDFIDFKNISPVIGTSILIALFGFYKDYSIVSNFQKYTLLTFLISILVYSSVIDNSDFPGIIENLYGFLGIYEISILNSFILTFLFYLIVINSINRLATLPNYIPIFSIVFFISMLYINYLNEFYTLNTISIIFIMLSLLFLLNNIVYKNNILIGHSGSLFLGFWIAYFLIQYIQTAQNANLTIIYSIKLENIIPIALSIISIPFFDTIRIFFIRIIKLKSPFSVDEKWYIHDILINAGMSAKRTSFLLTFVNSFVCILIFLLEPNFNSNELIVMYFSVSFLCYVYFEYLKKN